MSNVNEELPRPKVTPAPKWPLLAWLVPIAAVIVAAMYYRMSAMQRGPEVVVLFEDAAGLRVNETQVTHRGVRVGTVRGVTLTKDAAAAQVRIQFRQDSEIFAKEGARFWVVRPQISWENVSGLSTLVGGPYIDALPGTGSAVQEFQGLAKAPEKEMEGLRVVLHAEAVSGVQVGSPITYRGIEVGSARRVQLRNDSRGVDVEAVVRRPYSVLVRKNTRFWAVKGVDAKGGIFSGVEVKLESVRTILGGQVAMATPSELGEPAGEGEGFTLYEEPEEKWLKWSPVISVEVSGEEGKRKAAGSVREEAGKVVGEVGKGP